MRPVTKEDFKAHLIAQLERNESIHYSGGVVFNGYCLADVISQVSGAERLLDNAYFENCHFEDGTLNRSRFSGKTIFRNCTLRQISDCCFGEVTFENTRITNPFDQRNLSQISFLNYEIAGKSNLGISVRRIRTSEGTPYLPKHFFAEKIVNHPTLVLIISHGLQMPAGISGTLPDFIHQYLPLDGDGTNSTFHNLSFEDCVFTGVNLDKADFHLSQFVSCDFKGADFSGATITLNQLKEIVIAGGKTAKTIVRDGKLSDDSIELGTISADSFEGVIFQDCTLVNWNMAGSDLRLATFSDNCKFEGADFSNVKISYSSFQQITNKNLNRKPLFDGAILEEEIFFNKYVQCRNYAIRFVRCDFRHSTFQSGEEFWRCTFTDCNFDHTHLRGVFVSYEMFNLCRTANYSDIQGCTFSEQDLSNRNFSGMKLYDVAFQRCKFDANTNFSGAQFIGGNERQNHSSQSSFINSDISAPNFNNAVFIRTNFSACQFSRQTSLFHSFRDCNFNFCDLSYTRFDGVPMHGCSFISNCTLLETSFRDAVLHDVSFVSDGASARSLHAESLAGADLLGSSLPVYLEGFQPILSTGSEAIKSAKPLFIILVSLCFYTAIALRSTALDTAGEPLTLPFFTSLKLSKHDFFLFTLMAIGGIFVYFHLYLQKLWDSIRYLPAIFPDGAPVWDRISPWMFSVLAWRHFRQLRPYLKLEKQNPSNRSAVDKRIMANAPKNYRIQVFSCILLGWILPVGISGWSFLEVNNASNVVLSLIDSI